MKLHGLQQRDALLGAQLSIYQSLMGSSKNAQKLKKKRADTPEMITSRRRKSPPELTLQDFAGTGGIE